MQKFTLSRALALIVLCSSCAQTTLKPTPSANSSEAGFSAGVVSHDGIFEVISLTPNFQVKRATLPNGLKLIIVKDSSSPTFAYQTWMNVGSRNEVAGKTGLAHLFEHLMFKGTTHHTDGEFDAWLENAGVEGENAFTTNDHTVFVQELPKTQLDLIIGLESDRMVNLIVDDATFKTEREVVQNERRFRKENSPEGTLYQTLMETAFTEGAYHWPVIGYEQDLNLMSAQDARDFYEHYYTPNRATIVIVGDVDEQEVYQKILKAYGSILNKVIADAPIPTDSEQTAQRRKKLSLNIEVEKLWMAYKMPEASSPDMPALDAIQAILSEGKNSRLQRALVDSGIANSATAESLNLKDPGLFLIQADMQKGKTSPVAESIITRELERLKTNLVSGDELKRVLTLVKFSHYAQLATTNGKANYIGSSTLQLGSIEAALAEEEALNHVTPEQIQQTAQKYFYTSKLTVVVGVPKKGTEGATHEKNKTGLAIIVYALFASCISHAAEFYFEKDASLPLVYITGAFRGGSTQDPDGKGGVTNLMGQLMLRGTKNKTKQQLDLALDNIGGSLEFETRSEFISFRGAVLSENLPAFLSLLDEVLISPSFRLQDLEKLKKEYGSQLLDNLSQDSALARLRWDETFFMGHPYAKPAAGRLKDLQTITVADVQKQYARLISESQMILLASGDTSKDAFTAFLNDVKSKRNVVSHLNPIPDFTTEPKKLRVVIFDKPDRTQTQVQIGQKGVAITDPQLDAYQLANQAFGGGSFQARLMVELRVKRGWTYGAGSNFRSGSKPHSWKIGFFPKNADTPPAIKEAMELVRSLKKSGITEAEFNFAKQSIVNNSGFDYNTPQKRLENKMIEVIYGLPEGYYRNYGKRTAALTLPEVNQAIEKFVTPEHMLIGLVGTASISRKAIADALNLPEADIEVQNYQKE